MNKKKKKTVVLFKTMEKEMFSLCSEFLSVNDTNEEWPTGCDM